MNFYRNGSEEAELEKFERSQPDRIFGRPSGDYAPVSDIPIGGPTEVVAQNMQSASRKSAQVAQWAEDACIGLKQKYLQCKADSNVLTRTLCLAMQVEYLNCVEKKKKEAQNFGRASFRGTLPMLDREVKQAADVNFNKAAKGKPENV